jgi:hypothetical protein
MIVGIRLGITGTGDGVLAGRQRAHRALWDVLRPAYVQKLNQVSGNAEDVWRHQTDTLRVGAVLLHALNKSCNEAHIVQCYMTNVDADWTHGYLLKVSRNGVGDPSRDTPILSDVSVPMPAPAMSPRISSLNASVSLHLPCTFFKASLCLLQRICLLACWTPSFKFAYSTYMWHDIGHDSAIHSSNASHWRSPSKLITLKPG